MKTINPQQSDKLDQLLQSLPADLQDALRQLYAAENKLEIINAANWANAQMATATRQLYAPPHN